MLNSEITRVNFEESFFILKFVLLLKFYKYFFLVLVIAKHLRNNQDRNNFYLLEIKEESIKVIPIKISDFSA